MRVLELTHANSGKPLLLIAEHVVGVMAPTGADKPVVVYTTCASGDGGFLVENTVTEVLERLQGSRAIEEAASSLGRINRGADGGTAATM
jgi:hypothetical protein